MRSELERLSLREPRQTAAAASPTQQPHDEQQPTLMKRLLNTSMWQTPEWMSRARKSWTIGGSGSTAKEEAEQRCKAATASSTLFEQNNAATHNKSKGIDNSN